MRRDFAILNHVINPPVPWLLRSPLHVLASRWLVLITYTGTGDCMTRGRWARASSARRWESTPASS